MGQYPVFTGNRYNIGADSCSHQVEIGNHAFDSLSFSRGQCLNELKADSATTEFVVGVITILAFGVENSHCWREFSSRAMVIAYYKINALCRSIGDFVYGFDAAV